MKKTLLAIAAVAMVAASSFAQGNILIADSARGVWNTTGTPLFGGGLDWTLIAGPAATAPTVESIMNGVPTNNATGINASTAWSDITGQGGFFQVDGTNGLAVQGVVASNGGIAYNNAGAYQAANLTGGTTYTFYLVAYTAGSYGSGLVGWSQAFQYTPATGINTPDGGDSMVQAGLNPFGAGPIVASPEPTTIALAGLGGLALLGLRRRK